MQYDDRIGVHLHAVTIILQVFPQRQYPLDSHMTNDCNRVALVY